MASMVNESNPWTVESIYEFSYFCCPECNSKWHGKQEFVNHAFKRHPKAIDPLHDIADGSLDDVEFPEEDDDDRRDADYSPGPEIKTEEDEEEKPISSEVVFKHKDELLKALRKNELLPPSKEEDLEIKDEDVEDDDLEEDAPIVKREGFSCEMCDFNADTPRLLLMHVQNIHQNKKKSVPCPNCPEKFKSASQMKIHMLKAHKIAKRQEQCLCTLCGKTLIGRSNLKKHEREKHGIDNAKFIRKDRVVKIECPKCQEKFENPTMLNDHVIACTGEHLKFSCMRCSHKWASGKVLNIHLKVDHKIMEIHTCDKCGKCLKKKVSLLSHIKVDHDNIKDHVCHLCGRGFARQQGLQFHIKRVHENTGKHFCDRCPFKAITKPELEIHINEVHTKAIKFHCDQCNFFCYRKGGLAAHIKNVHLKLRPHRCDSCGQAFVRRKELEKHKEWANHN